MHFLIYLIASFSAFGLTAAEPPCHLSELMGCLNILIDYLNTLPKRSLPETPDEVSSMCEAFTDGIKCWDDFKGRCMTPIQKEIEVLLTEGIRDLKEQFCQSGSNLKEKYVGHAKCWNTELKNGEVKQQIEYLMAILEKVQTLPMDKRLPFSCCGYRKVSNDITRIIEGKCGTEMVEYAGELISMAVAQLPNIICEGYDETMSECKELLPPDGAAPTGDLKDNPVYQWVRNTLKNFID